MSECRITSQVRAKLVKWRELLERLDRIHKWAVQNELTEDALLAVFQKYTCWDRERLLFCSGLDYYMGQNRIKMGKCKMNWRRKHYLEYAKRQFRANLINRRGNNY